MIINQKRLRYFHAVHTQGQIRRAADHLNTDCSVIARQIYLLEQEIGVRLFDRHPRGMVPTEVGDLLLEYYQRNWSAQQDFEMGMQELSSMRRGNINIAMFSSYVDALMNEVINDFYKKNLSCFVGIQEESCTSHIINKVLLDEAHIGIIHSNHHNYPGIRCYIHFPLPLRMLVNNNHPLSKKGKGDIKDIALYPVVLPPTYHCGRQAIQSVEHSEKIKLIQAFVSDSILARKKAAVAGYGGALISAFSARREIQDNQLVPFEIDHPTFNSMEVCLIVKQGKTLSPLANQLCRLIAENFSIFKPNNLYSKPIEANVSHSI